MPKKKACLDWSVVGKDGFLYSLSRDAQMLYVVMQFHADGEGALDGVGAIQRMLELRDNSAFKELVDIGLITKVDKVFFVRHWWVHNKRDKYNYPGCNHQAERNRLFLDENKTYQLAEEHPEPAKTETSQPPDLKQSVAGLTKALPQSEISPEKKRTEKNSGSEARKEDFRSRNRDCPSCGEIGQLIDEGGAMVCQTCGAAYPFNSPEYQQRFGSLKPFRRS